jgi:hypothetical protein
MWLLSGRCNSKARLDGKVAIVTGANCGIGKATALDFVRRGEQTVAVSICSKVYLWYGIAGGGRVHLAVSRKVAGPISNGAVYLILLKPKCVISWRVKAAVAWG